ncbi:uncharacterized protein LOC132730727 [Ruditapes philippinarum]|uniref:uncharacterized protein LOC132730727 n=1 Tax=Ruditapes philippinarum TaxID=129788 RepID=UPI00295A83B8|nr:uncharacterized protein LOC132730727 [Ruditapes philippinarum]
MIILIIINSSCRKRNTIFISGVFIVLFIVTMTSYLFRKTEHTDFPTYWKQTTIFPRHRGNTLVDKTDVVLQYDSLTRYDSKVFNEDSTMDANKQKDKDNLTKTVKSLPLQPSINSKVQQSINSKLETTKEVTHVGFLKVHKAASSTAQSIILRFGLERNLSIVIPTPIHYISKRKYFFSDIWPSFHELSSVRGNIDTKLKYDILSHHMVFNHKKVSQLLHNDTVYVAIVRDPFDLFVSAAVYYKFAFKTPYHYLFPNCPTRHS